MRAFFAILLALAATGTSAAAQDAVYIIRHAEKELFGADPALTPEGRRRALDWAEMLKNMGVEAISTSDALRTQETGGLIANVLGLQPTMVPANDIAGLLDTLEFDHEEDRVLIVAHAETIPHILERLGVQEDISIAQSEFANLFILLQPASGDPLYLHLLMP